MNEFINSWREKTCLVRVPDSAERNGASVENLVPEKYFVAQFYRQQLIQLARIAENTITTLQSHTSSTTITVLPPLKRLCDKSCSSDRMFCVCERD